MKTRPAYVLFVVAMAGLPASLSAPPLAAERIVSEEPRPHPWGLFKNRANRAARTRLLGAQTANVQWQRFLDAHGIQSQLAIARDGTIYAGSLLGDLYAFGPDGSIKWSYDLGIHYITAGPALATDGTVYVSSENGNLHAIDPDGGLSWTFALDGYAGPSSCPAVGEDGTIYVGADLLYAVHPDGTLNWSFDPGSPVEGPPAIGADGTLYFPSHDYLYALNPDGTLKWRSQGQSPYDLGSAPAIGRDGSIYVNTNLGGLHAFRPDGTLRWTYESEGIVMDVPSSPGIAADGTVYFGGGGEYGGNGGYLHAVKPDGTLKWRFFAGCDQTAPSVGGDGTVYFGSNYCSTIHALNPDGTLKWTYFKDGVYMRTAPAIGPGQRLYVGFLGNPGFGVRGGLLAIGP
jgi:outer membrane protein assembly factor BamB